MKYEIVHDIIANQVFRKASETQRRRAQAKNYVEGRFDFFSDEQTDTNAEPTAGLLSIEELRKIDVYKDEINFKPEVLEYIEASRKALATAAETENARLNAALVQAEINRTRELSLAEHRDIAQEQVILRTRIGMITVSLLGLLLFFGAFYAQTAYWKAKASEAVAEAISAFHVEDDITTMYQKAAEALQFNALLPEAQEQFYQSIYNADRQNRLYYTNINTDTEINTVENQENDTQPHNIISQTEQYIAILSDTATLTLYDLTKNKNNLQTFQIDLPKNDSIFMIAFSKDDKYLLVAATNTLFQYEINTQTQKKYPLKGLKYIKSNKDYFFAITNTGIIKKINFITKKEHTFVLPSILTDYTFSDAAISNNGKNLILRTDDNGFNTLFALQILEQTLSTKAIIENVLAHNFNDSILIIQQEAEIKLYNINSSTPTKPYYTKEIAPEEIRHIKISPDLLIISHTLTDEIFSINSTNINPIGSISKSILDTKEDFNYNTIANKDFLLLSYHKTAFLYPKNNPTNILTQYKMIGHKENIIFQQILHKSQKVITLSNDGQIKTWQIASPCVVELNTKNNTQPIVHTDFSNSDKYVLTVANTTHQVVLWQTDSLSKPYIFPLAPTLAFACFSANNRYLIMPFGKILSYYDLNELQSQKKISLTNINLKENIKWCKRSKNGNSILAITQSNCLISLNTNDANSQIDTLALYTTQKNKKPNYLRTKKPIVYLNTSIDSASTSASEHYIIVYSPKSTELINIKASTTQNHITLTTDSLLALCFSPKTDALLIATLNPNKNKNPLQQIKITHFSTTFLVQKHLLPAITSDFNPQSLAFGKTNEMILYKLNNNQYIYRTNKKTTEILKTDYLAYHQKSDKWIISHANIVSPNLKQNFFATNHNLNAALQGYTTTANKFKQNNINRPSRWTSILSSPKGDYWAILKNEYDKYDGKNIFAIYNKNCQPIAEFSALQNTKLNPYKGNANIQFSPKGNFLLTKSTEGGVKIWFWNIPIIKKAMNKFLEPK